ncbi:molybdopterin-binding protein [Promicromonospora sp. NPDC057138]|uniref:molybdopterin-binding protein n=1 Tax=Promicromonospora sp. NPDC057138 TaxID=3346031 RepID=UPI00364421ED
MKDRTDDGRPVGRRDEILDGSTTDTNSGWVCRQIAGRGAGVVRTAVVPDDPREIAQGLDFLLQVESVTFDD